MRYFRNILLLLATLICVPSSAEFGSTNESNRDTTRDAIRSIELFSIADFENDPSGGDIQLTSDLHRVKDQIIDGNALIASDGEGLRFQNMNRTRNFYLYAGAATWLRTLANEGVEVVDLLDGLYIHNNPAATLFDLQGMLSENSDTGQVPFFFSDSGVFAFNPGTVTGFDLVNIKSVTFNNLITGLTIADSTNVRVLNTEMMSLGVGAGPMLTFKGQADTIKATGVTFQLGASEKGIRIDPGLPDDVVVTVTNCDVTGGGTLFDTSGLAGRESGVFTSVADASISATAITAVTSGTVLSEGTIARFNHSGTDVFVGQLVTVSGFSTNTNYNTTGRVTVTGTGFFELLEVAFGTDETGSYASDSVTLTDVAHGLLNGDPLTVDTDLAVDYDGGSYAYNVTTDTFQISRPFTSSLTGTWNTFGLNQQDPRVLASGNPGFAASAYLLSGSIKNNVTATTVANGSWSNIETPALAPGTAIERWKYLVPSEATARFIGNEPFDGIINVTFTANKGGSGTDTFRVRLSADSGGGFVAFPDAEEVSFSLNTAIELVVTISVPAFVLNGTSVRPEIYGDGTTDPVTFRNVSMTSVN